MWWQKLRDAVISLWPFVNQRAREEAKAKGDEAAAKVKNLDDAKRAAEDRE